MRARFGSRKYRKMCEDEDAAIQKKKEEMAKIQFVVCPTCGRVGITRTLTREQVNAIPDYHPVGEVFAIEHVSPKDTCYLGRNGCPNSK